MDSSTSQQNVPHCNIAIIGIGCLYPGAKTPLELWENILSRRQQFREMPDVRLPLRDYYNPDPETPGKLYQSKASVIDGYQFDWLDKRIPKRTYESTDIVHWIALDTALQALSDAGYNKDTIEKEKTGVVLGNTLTGEFTRSNNMLLRWPYVYKTLAESLKKKGLHQYTETIASTMEQYYKSVFTDVNEDTLAGGLANTIAGRVCNYLDLHGGGYIVDGACSSSLIAVCTAANYLELGQMDMVVAGGVDVSLDTFELIGFSKTKALTRDEMRVYDKEGKGFLPGEGCGMVIMKRLDDAIRDKDPIYATLKGWGISSDGKGGITAPSAEGQARALKRAHRKANIDTTKIDFIEGHGTGTTVGDRIELEGISLALQAENDVPKRSCGVTSFKSIVGHTKAAAGVGAFIKTVIALNQRIMPPTAGLKEYNPIFENQAKVLFPILQGEIQDRNKKMLAGVSAMGFGGINSHVVLESGNAPYKHLKPTMDEQKLMLSNQDSEVFLFSSSNKQDLIHQLDRALKLSDKSSYAEMADMAAYLNKDIDLSNGIRAGVVARNPFELRDRLLKLKEQTEKSSMQSIETTEQDFVVTGRKKENLSVGVLFPGQGSQKLGMSSKLIGQNDATQKTYAHAEHLFSKLNANEILSATYKNFDRLNDLAEKTTFKNILKQTQIAQPAITLSSLLWFQHLNNLGISFNYSAGHSLGEIMAMYAAGYMDADTSLKFASYRGKTMAGCGSGTMASLVCTQKQALELISLTKHYVTIANINAPEQTVISGDDEGIDEIVSFAEKRHIGAVKLPVSAAFHSKLIAATSDRIMESDFFSEKTHGNSNTQVVSSVTGELFKQKTSLKNYFAEQCVSQVNFIKTIETLSEKCDILIEAGPGKVLSGLVQSITDKIRCFPVEAYANDDISFNRMILNLFVQGANINTSQLYNNRLIREFVPASEKEFLMNPLERPFPENLQNGKIQTVSEIPGEVINLLDFDSYEIKAYLQKRGGFIRDLIATDMRHMLPGTSQNDIERIANNDINDRDSQPSVDKPSELKTLLFNAIENATGFTQEHFTINMKLLDDFNLDSIKAGTLLANLSKELDIATKLNPINLVNASIDQIIEEFTKFLPQELNKVTNSSDTSVASEVVNLLSEQTGFPTNELKPSYRLLDDLNLDSIKAGGTIALLAKKYNLQGNFEAAKFANASIAEITDYIQAQTDSTDPGKTIGDAEEATTVLFNIIEEKTGFPANEIKPEFKLLDDLNLDSIKAGAVIAELTKSLSITGELEPAKLANATINEILQQVKAIISSKNTDNLSSTNAGVSDRNIWVQAYSADIDEVPLNNDGKLFSYWKSIKTCTVYADSSQEESDVFCQQLGKLAISTSAIHYTKLASLSSSNINQLFVFVPHIKSTSHQIEESVHMLAEVAAFQPVQSTNIIFIQLGSGNFGRKHYSAELNPVSAASFAASLHLERPICKIKCVEISDTIGAKSKVSIILKEAANENIHSISGWENEDTRIEMRYELAEQQIYNRNLDIDENDVILVTGGAKGITAECALAMALKYKCKMALIGSSELTDQSFDVHETLKKYSDNKLVAQYYRCDISNMDDVYQVINSTNETLGKVTGVIHGAGKNVPRRAEHASDIEVMGEIAPKVYGAYNLIDALQNNKLKFFSAFTSIIGVTGMQGNSWYAFANETTDRLLRNLNTQYNIPTISLAYSVWSEVGMGAKMGSVDTLSKMGIDAIPPNKGVQQFLKWIEYGSSDQQIVIASRLGGLDTWNRKEHVLPKSRRYLEEIIFFEPGVEIITRAKLNRKTDRYVENHNFRGSLLFPTVFGIEAMSQAIAYLTGTDIKQVSIENIQLTKPIVLPDDGDTTIEIKASLYSGNNETRSSKVYKVGISTELSDFTDDHFSAEFNLDSGLIEQTYEIERPATALPIHPASDLYSWLLFQGQSFQRINEVYHVDSQRAVFSTSISEDDTSWICLSADMHSPFQLASPLHRDTFLQSSQLILTRNVVLPVQIDKWEIYNSRPENGGYVECKFLETDGTRYKCDVRFISEDNKVLEHIQGYHLQKVGDDVPKNPSPEKLPDREQYCLNQVNYYLEQFPDLKKHTHITVKKISNDFNQIGKKTRRSIAQSAFDYLVQRDQLNELKSATLIWNENGKPHIANNSKWNISITHKNSFLILVVSKHKLGCDLELVTQRTKGEWDNLLNFKHKTLWSDLMKLDNDVNISGTRIWTYLESVLKAKGKLPTNINLTTIVGNSTLCTTGMSKSDYSLLSFPINIYPSNKLVFTLGINKIIDSLVASETISESIPANANNDESRYITNFVTTFKDCRSFYGKTFFTNFPHWMGVFREQVLAPVKTQLMKDLGSGKYGMVTNQSSVKIYNEAEALENIQGKLSLSDNCNFDESYIDIRYEWYKMNENSNPLLLADCHLSTTWVEILDRGIVKKSPIPKYFLDYLEEMIEETSLVQLASSGSSDFISEKDLGKNIYNSDKGPRPQIQLLTHKFETGMHNGNTVGNLYYSNYYDWQAKMIEKYIYNHCPSVFLNNGKSGEFICLHAEVNHLQEAMPFESIVVTMYIKRIMQNGLELFFEYFSAGANKNRKLAYGSNTLIWANRKSDKELPKVSKVNNELMEALTQELNQPSVDIHN